MRWTVNSFLKHLDFTDDICLMSSNRKNMKSRSTKLTRSIGLNTNENKIKVMLMSGNSTQLIALGNNTEEVEDFSYLDSVLSNNETAKDIKSKK